MVMLPLGEARARHVAAFAGNTAQKEEAVVVCAAISQLNPRRTRIAKELLAELAFALDIDEARIPRLMSDATALSRRMRFAMAGA